MAATTYPQMSNDWIPKTVRTERFGEFSFHDGTCQGIYCIFYHCSCSDPRYGDFEVLFYPPHRDGTPIDDDGTGWTGALASAERRGEEILSAQAAILQTGAQQLMRLFKDYEIDVPSIQDLLPDLTIASLHLCSTEDDRFGYAPSKWFPDFELFISVDRDLRITETYFDG